MRRFALSLLLFCMQSHAAETLESLVARVKSELAAQRTVSADEIRTLKAQEVVWRDMSLGCGKPNESYAQVEVEGYHVVLEHEGEQFDYRARKDGRFTLCTTAARRIR